jgi:uncharacterized membrane protein
MRSFRPLHGLLLVVAVLVSGIALERLVRGEKNKFQQVSPDASGRVVVNVASWKPSEVHFFRFINRGNQEVRFFVGRDGDGNLLAAFDASDNDYKMNRGFHVQDSWVVNNKCSTSFRLREVNSHPSGCAPVPVRFQSDGKQVVLAESDLLDGWRYFR